MTRRRLLREHPAYAARRAIKLGTPPLLQTYSEKSSTSGPSSDSLSPRAAYVDSLKAAYTEEQRNEMKSPAALASSLLGLIADDYVLNPVLGSKLGGQSRVGRPLDET